MYKINSIYDIIDKSVILPPPDLSVSSWADENRRLSPEASSVSGKWDTSFAEYQRGIMDAVNDPLCEKIVCMTSSQVGKTEIELNIIGFFIDYDPAPILVVYPTETLAKAFSEDRLTPMLRDTVCLQGKVKDPRKRDSKNTKLHKMYPGGHITMVGANSPANLAFRPIRIVLGDEIDRYPINAGGAEGEGDVIALAYKRTKTFWNRKLVIVSTPTIKGQSRIEDAYNESDMRRFFVPCVHCGHEQVLKWANVVWEKIDGEHRLETAKYKCEKCGGLWEDSDRINAVKSGKWIAEKEFTGTAGFHVNEIYSPWSSLREIVKDFLDVKHSNSKERMQTWVNTTLGETWEEEGLEVDDIDLYKKRENYSSEELPDGVLVLVNGTDVQDDRIESHTIGFGIGEENWSIEYQIFYGNPAEDEVWRQLDAFLNKTYKHQSGAVLNVACSCIDSGGHHTSRVYDFVREREQRRVYAIKGSSSPGMPIVSRYSIVSKCKLFNIGTDTAKDLIYSRLNISDFGAGYMHFREYDEEWFRQLASEKKVTTYIKGVPRMKWKQKRARNEVLDTYVYANAAIKILNPDFKYIENSMKPKNIKVEEQKEAPKDELKITKQINRPIRRSGSFVKGF